MTWDDTVDSVAELLGTTSEFLVVSSMEWRWLKPQNSAWLPLRNESGYNSMINQLLSPPKNVSPAYIIIKMDEPMKPPLSISMPWLSQRSAGPSSGPGAFESTYRAVMGADDEPSDDDDRPKKKVPFDQGLEEEIQSISEKYKAGMCSVHPDIECFHSRINDLHFALDRPKKIVWAAAILKKNGTSTIFGPPLGSNHFSVKAAIKKKPPGANVAPAASFDAPPPPAPTQTAAAAPTPNPYAYLPTTPYPPMHPMGYPPFPPYPIPGFYGHSAHVLPWQDSPRRQRSWEDSSPPRQSSSKRRREERLPDPPSSPAVSGGSLDEFIARNPDLPSQTKSFLLELDFQVGDDLSVVTEAEWKAAGLALLSWNRILKKYNKYKNSLRS
ncbi:hypothetical protein DFH07DRAFT_772982 [Mycena maculata]|uniref:Uncharacterized protein n=1 Tax=Mycena maculata TaxID=230809 RepID=A0AAD7J8A9_9AGAR|nr:hypothetical protein DFH07DRAFT_772982 [Mycena maculata]